MGYHNSHIRCNNPDPVKFDLKRYFKPFFFKRGMGRIRTDDVVGIPMPIKYKKELRYRVTEKCCIRTPIFNIFNYDERTYSPTGRGQG